MSGLDAESPNEDLDDSELWQEDPSDMTAGAELAAGAVVAGKRIALAGKLGGMNRREASNLLRSFGAAVVDLDAEAIDWVVIGAEEAPLSESDLLSGPLRAAAAAGELEVVAETELWQRLGLVEIERSVKRFYTPAMLADLLGVSVRVIRRWHRRGLIVPARTLHKLPYFDFQEVATARRLAELVAAGASPQAIEDRLRELAEVLPEVTRPLAQLSVLIEGRQVLLRHGEGLLEPGGQLRFDFAASDQRQTGQGQTEQGQTEQGQTEQGQTGQTAGAPEIISLAEQTQKRRREAAFSEESLAFPPQPEPAEGEDALLAAVYGCEDRGDLSGAIDHCRAILARDGVRADICFQLGELLYRDGQVEAARERYFCAIELDETFVEARTSLACVLAETGRGDLAIAALRGVLSLHEDYPDAHYHLATLLEADGQTEAAAEHWQRLQQLAPESPWVQPPLE